ncbi:MAG: transcription termination/antitermination protein NusG, partial [Candidatus Acidiferrales bacterium]
SWYAVHTMARHEKRIESQLREKGLFTFLPLLRQTHRWSDRRMFVEVPMFSCYAFVRMARNPEERLKVLRTPGVLAFVGSEKQGTPIPDVQIESLRTTVAQRIGCVPYPYIGVGKRVRICGGALDGVEGVLLRQGEDQRLIVSVDLLQRSIAIRVEGYGIELV